jgi:hypothetical protein
LITIGVCADAEKPNNEVTATKVIAVNRLVIFLNI